jgi:hypothetical protein
MELRKMKLKIALFSATALGMLMAAGAAYAGDYDSALLSQVDPVTGGAGNSAGVDQLNAHDSNVGGISTLPATQHGDGNYLSITQVAGFNSAGATSPGIDQENNFNDISIYQGYQDDPNWNPGNTIGSILQEGYAGSNPGFYVNQTNITQYYDDFVGSVTQNHNVSGGANAVTINETGSGVSGDIVNSVTQTGAANSLNLALTNSSAGGANGHGSFTPDGAADVAANPNAYGLTTTPWNVGEATVNQSGTSNSIGFTIVGNDNKYGFDQLGSGNIISGGINVGFGDEIAAVQDGTNNGLGVTMAGYGNQVGVIQLDAGNIGSVIIDGTDNEAGLLQFGEGGLNTGTVESGSGSSNSNIGVIQYATAGTNNATVNVASGSSNTAVVGQYASGGSNSAGVTINGSNNNLLTGYTPSTFSGTAADTGTLFLAATSQQATIGNLVSNLQGTSALTAALGSSLAGALEGQSLLTPGLMTQVTFGGGSNSLSVNVSTSNNVFSTLQGAAGGSNSLNATIEGGNNNELSVAQVTRASGQSNVATTVQNGSFNSIGLVQVGTNSTTINQ